MATGPTAAPLAAASVSLRRPISGDGVEKSGVKLLRLALHMNKGFFYSVTQQRATV
jgi:hypothetical protein